MIMLIKLINFSILLTHLFIFKKNSTNKSQAVRVQINGNFFKVKTHKINVNDLKPFSKYLINLLFIRATFVLLWKLSMIRT